MSNLGKTPSVSEDSIQVSRDGLVLSKPRRQPAQGGRRENRKLVVSKPMDYNELAQAQGVLEAEREKVRREHDASKLDPKDRE